MTPAFPDTCWIDKLVNNTKKCYLDLRNIEYCTNQQTQHMNIKVPADYWVCWVHFEERIVGQKKGSNERQCSKDVFVFGIGHSGFAYQQ